MYPLKFEPILKQTLWGGDKIIPFKHLNSDLKGVGESWEISGVEDNESVVANGPDKGLTLADMVRRYREELVGEANYARFGNKFPLLIKFIDAKQDLSIQVHPTDELAKKRHNSMGKTEMWYVMDAAEGASLFYGFAKEVSEEEFEERIRNHTLTDVLNKVMIHKGDVLFIDPGTIHAIGAGSLIAEIQQNSNVTYRVYDYGRKGPDGKERELHVDKALQVTKREPAATDRDFGPHVASCEYFTVDKVILDGLRRKKLTGEADGTSFVSVLVMSGAGKITASGQTMEVKKGDSIFITAGSGEYELEGDMEALITTV